MKKEIVMLIGLIFCIGLFCVKNTVKADDGVVMPLKRAFVVLPGETYDVVSPTIVRTRLYRGYAVKTVNTPVVVESQPAPAHKVIEQLRDPFVRKGR